MCYELFMTKYELVVRSYELDVSDKDMVAVPNFQVNLSGSLLRIT